MSVGRVDHIRTDNCVRACRKLHRNRSAKLQHHGTCRVSVHNTLYANMLRGISTRRRSVYGARNSADCCTMQLTLVTEVSSTCRVDTISGRGHSAAQRPVSYFAAVMELSKRLRCSMTFVVLAMSAPQLERGAAAGLMLILMAILS